ncbi:hypothetical protein LRH25_00715 [Ideonella azotifigens]|uniref:Uncharacterized protein n=2 Tax=Ideonella azotifigens TaxID=513160 RepID=A0ABP3VMJ9_9BURK|nr:hypothetical protein [Ideonella azotifigens]MCD2338859.1 hypothetical protein [Ideonella azotifigens]
MSVVAMAAHGARIDWAKARVIGFSVPADAGEVFDVVELALDDRVVSTAVANRSVFELAQALAGLPLPSREACAFELRVPSGSLLPSQLGQDSVRLTVRSTRGDLVFEHALQGPQELLHMADGAPLDLLYEVQFRGVRDGALHGVVLDKLGSGRQPTLYWRLNEGPPERLWLDSAGDARAHFFLCDLPVKVLSEGRNLLHVTGRDGQPLAVYPIQLGAQGESELQRRVVALEAQVGFLNHLMMSQPSEALPARLALLKSEIVGICSEMLTMQRANFEREALAAVEMALAARAAPASPPPALSRLGLRLGR